MKTDYIIRSYKEGDEVQINDLFNQIFNERRSIDEWRWKLARNPNGTIIIVAEADGKIVGQYPSFIYRCKIGDDVVSTVQVVDNFVHPGFRKGKGIQKEMYETWSREAFEKKNNIFGFGFPNKDAYAVGKRFLHYKDACSLPTLYMNMEISSSIKSKLPFIPEIIVKGMKRIERIYHKRRFSLKNHREDIKVARVHSFDSRINDLWERVKTQYPIINVREQRFLTWRYVERPENPYQIFIAEKDNRISGYVVLRIREEGGRRDCYIVDLLVKDDAVQYLIKSILLYLVSQDIQHVYCRITKMHLYHILFAMGFREREGLPSVPVVYQLNPFKEADERYKNLLKDSSNWYITWGDSDGM